MGRQRKSEAGQIIGNGTQGTETTGGSIPRVNIPGGDNGNSSSTAATTGGETARRKTKENSVSEVDGLSVTSSIPIPSIPVATTPKKRSSSKDFDKTLESNIRMLIGTGFGFASKITQSPIWEVSDEEAQSISTPVTKILQRLGVNESMNKYADYIALGTALTIVVVPRLLIQKAELTKGGHTPDGGKKKKSKDTVTKPVGNINPVNTPVLETSIKASLDLGV